MFRFRSIYLLLIMITAAPLLLSGCAKFNIHLTINKNGSVDSEIVMMAVKKLLTNDPSIESYFFDEKKELLKEQGFTIADLTNEKITGFRAVKKFVSVEEFSSAGLNAALGLESQEPFKVEKNFFTATYYFNADIDLTNVFEAQGKTIALFSPDLNFTVTLPVKPLEHNATRITEDGRTLIWELSPTGSNKLQFTARAPNLTAVVILLALAVALMGVIMTALIRRIRVIANEDSCKGKKINR